MHINMPVYQAVFIYFCQNIYFFGFIVLYRKFEELKKKTLLEVNFFNNLT